MTYNFDPDRWYQNQRHALEARREREGLSAEAYQAALDDLERRYEDMAGRLDKPFGLSDTPRTPAPPHRE